MNKVKYIPDTELVYKVKGDIIYNNSHQWRIQLFSHNDLDGIGNNILVKLFFPNQTVDITNTDYNNINRLVEEFLDNLIEQNENPTKQELYTHIFFTDISIKEEVAERLDKICSKYNITLVLRDHHQTAIHLNKYPWAYVAEKEESGFNNCGTSLFYQYLLENFNNSFLTKNMLNNFVEKIRRYDTWEWFEVYDDCEAKDLNDLFRILGTDDFVSNMIEKIKYQEKLLDKIDEVILDVEKRKIKRYVTKKENRMRQISIDEHLVGVIFAEEYFTDITLTILNNHPELDYLAIVYVDNNGVSYRTQKEEINVGLIAKKYNGGGHPKAAGSSLIGDKSYQDFRQVLINNNIL